MAFTTYTRLVLRQRLQEKVESSPFFTDTEANAAINEALRWWNLYTGVWKERVVMPTVADQVYYTLPATLTYNARIEHNGRTLTRSSFSDLDDGRPGWEGETTDDAGLPDTVELWLPVGMTAFALWPADADDDNSLLIDGVAVTPTLDSDVDTVDLDSGDIEMLLGEALWIICFKDPGRLPHAQAWHDAFLNAALAANRRLNASSLFRHAIGRDVDRDRQPMETDDGSGSSQ